MGWYELLHSVLNGNTKNDSDKRKSVAHDILKIRPTKKFYNSLLDNLKKEAKNRYLKEVAKKVNKEEYDKNILSAWNKFIKEL